MARNDVLPGEPDVTTDRLLASPFGRLAAGALALALLSLSVGFLVGHVRGQSHPRVVEERVSCYSAIPISCQMDDGWYVGVPTDVHWVDSEGSHHQDGRPDCLPPTATEHSVTVGVMPVDMGDTMWRQVVWVRC